MVAAPATLDHPPAAVSQQPASRPDAREEPEALHRRLVDERRSPRELLRQAAGYRTAVCWLLALFALVSVITAVWQLLVNINIEEGIDLDAERLLYAQILAGVGLVVCWLIWFARVRAVAEWLAPGRSRYQPSMAVKSWFIPGVNLFRPKQIADDIWHASSPPGWSGRMAPAGPLHVWWSLWLVTFLTWPLFWPTTVDWRGNGMVTWLG
ncbi:DUF4328 domain-containing protein [Streptomyces tanashiensis]